MNWSYVAGLFDGEGNPSVKFAQRGKLIGIQASIEFTGSTVLLNELSCFLSAHNVKPSDLTLDHNSLGSCVSMRIYRWKDAKIFLLHTINKLIEKKTQSELLLDAINAYYGLECRANKTRKYTIEFLRKLDTIRHDIHSYAKKGRKELTEYDFSFYESRHQVME
jgi:hypothetical protein